ncbi:MAG: LysR substrate-binding domain-containing protein [Alphaproteobacteria bacterium]|nr:LysR substrate-binding domain-containing protein [Alphaproteobacteria bacterium]
MPPLKALLAFEAASRHGSFAQGAEELGVTPSAVSHQIQQLEEFLGVPLFQRHAGRAVLTSAGRTYAREIEHAMGVIAEATTLVAPQSQSGHLVIASGPSFAAKWLQPRLPDFLRAHPDVRVRLSTISAPADLESSRFDIAIAYGSPPASQRHAVPLLVERLRPLCSPALAAAIDLRTPCDLARATLIHSVNGLTWADYLRRAGVGELRPTNELWLDRSTMAIDAAIDGLGVVLESEVLAADELRDGRLVAPFGEDAHTVETTSYFLVRSAGFRSGTQIAAFEKWLRAALATANLTIRADRPR